LAGYSHRSGGNVAIVIVILAAVIVGAVVVQQTYGSSVWLKTGTALRERFDALREKMSNTKPGQAATTATTSNPGTFDEQIPANPQTATVSPSSSPPQLSDHPPAQASPAAVVSSQDAVANPRLSRKLAQAAESDSTDRGTQNPAEEANAVRVAPAVMEANLLASRVPAYPETAKEDRIEGPVVVQAIISKDGFVDRVHVIEGNPRLRSAAAEAISKWRYKPYLLNGRPVEVATTITVDFSLDDW
jgi:TonB family protein